jgi:hypothetical protein
VDGLIHPRRRDLAGETVHEYTNAAGRIREFVSPFVDGLTHPRRRDLAGEAVHEYSRIHERRRAYS